MCVYIYIYYTHMYIISNYSTFLYILCSAMIWDHLQVTCTTRATEDGFQTIWHLASQKTAGWIKSFPAVENCAMLGNVFLDIESNTIRLIMIYRCRDIYRYPSLFIMIISIIVGIPSNVIDIYRWFSHNKTSIYRGDFPSRAPAMFHYHRERSVVSIWCRWPNRWLIIGA